MDLCCLDWGVVIGFYLLIQFIDFRLFNLYLKGVYFRDEFLLLIVFYFCFNLRLDFNIQKDFNGNLMLFLNELYCILSKWFFLMDICVFRILVIFVSRFYFIV